MWGELRRDSKEDEESREQRSEPTCSIFSLWFTPDTKGWSENLAHPSSLFVARTEESKGASQTREAHCYFNVGKRKTRCYVCQLTLPCRIGLVYGVVRNKLSDMWWMFGPPASLSAASVPGFLSPIATILQAVEIRLHLFLDLRCDPWDG